MLKVKGLRGTLAALAVLMFAAAPASAADTPVGKVSIETMSVGVGLGVSWGQGVLEYQGQSYPFTVTGFSVGDVGAAKMVARGEVYNLKRVEDFTGMFMAASAGGTVGAGAGAAAMRNQNEVNMVWTATNQGLNFSLAKSGLNVKLTDEARQQAARVRREAAAATDSTATTPRATQ
jgi:hypothetical protein